MITVSSNSILRADLLLATGFTSETSWDCDSSDTNAATSAGSGGEDNGANGRGDADDKGADAGGDDDEEDEEDGADDRGG